MSKLIKTIIIISSFILTTNTFAQVNNKYTDANRFVYWFHLKVKTIEDDSTGHIFYKITEVENKLSHGKLIDYQKDLFKSLKNDIMPIGPFNDFQEAWNAKIIYEHNITYEEEAFLNNENSNQYDTNLQVFWFILHLEKNKKNKIKLIRKPGSIASGSYYDFYNYLKYNLNYKIFSIGPFSYMPEAEEAKRIYRIKKRQYLRKKIIFRFENSRNMY